MSLLQDVYNETKYQSFRSRITQRLSPSLWIRLHKYRVQRANRGWSDRDMWGMGDHLARVTADMLKDLKEGMTSWPEWFKYNVGEEGKGAYTDLQQVIDDIEGYLDWSETSWTDDLDYAEGNTGKYSISWSKKGKKITEAEITHRINKHTKEGAQKYKKARKAMGFFGRNFGSFWD